MLCVGLTCNLTLTLPVSALSHTSPKLLTLTCSSQGGHLMDRGEERGRQMHCAASPWLVPIYNSMGGPTTGDGSCRQCKSVYTSFLTPISDSLLSVQCTAIAALDR